MKKLFLLLMLVLSLSLFLVACGGSEEPAADDAANDAATAEDSGDNAEATPEPAADGEVIEIKLATVISETHPSFQAMEQFKTNLEANSNGRFQVTLYGGGQLGTQEENIDQMRIGDIQMATVNPVVMTSTIGQLAVLEDFFLFDDYEHAYAVFDGEAGQFIHDAFNDVGSQGVGFLPLGFQHFTNNKMAINTMADFDGIKIRGYSPIQIAAFEALGCTTSAVSWNELYTSLQQKLLDGTSLAPSNMLIDKFVEVSPYYSLTSHEFGVDVLLAGSDFLNSLGEDDKALLMAEVEAACTALRPIAEQENINTIASLEADFGAIINEVDDTLKAEMKEAMSAATTPLIVELAGQENYDTFQALLEEARQ